MNKVNTNKKVSTNESINFYKKDRANKKVCPFRKAMCLIVLLLSSIVIITGCKNMQNNLTGDIDTGDIDTGDINTGDTDTGDIDTGDIDTGDINTGDTDTGDIHTEDIPSLQLEYIEDDRTEIVIIDHGTASWSYKDHGIESDALHPLDAVGSIPEILNKEEQLEIKLKFSSQPTSYTVRSWILEYKQNSEAYDNFYEEVEINNDAFTVPDDEAGYIYLVHALWPQGNVYYGFNVVNSELNDITTPVIIQDVIIGGMIKGVWMDYEELYNNNGAIDFDGFEYDVYSDSRRIASAIGGPPTSWMSGEPSFEDEYIHEYCIVKLYENENRIKDYDIALKADWDLYPRLFTEDNSKQDYYTDIMKEHLIEVGLENPETTVKQTIKVDLEGDGIDEELIYTDNKIEGTFEEVKKGDNAVLIFRRYVDGKPINQVLDEHIIKEDPEYPSPYRLLFSVDSIADIDGDGVMEIIVNNQYYEGFGWSIYKLKDNQLEQVAANGIGA